jgi:hypothetical protein
MSTKSLDLTRKVALGAALVVLSATGLSAIPTPHMATRFGLIGIVSGQTLRLNVVNVSEGTSCPSDPTSWSLGFVDLNGAIVKGPDGNAIERTVSLRRGQGAFLDLMLMPTDSLRSRVQIRPVVRAMIVDGGRAMIIDGCIVAATAEVFDNETGQTQFLVPGETVYLKEVDPGPAKPSSR